MQPIGMSLDTINAQSRLALGQTGKASAASNPLAQSLSMVSNFLPANSAALIQVAGLSSNAIPASVNTESPAEKPNLSSLWALMFASQAKSSSGGEQDMYTLLATSMAAASTPELGLTQTQNNLDLTKFLKKESTSQSGNSLDLNTLTTQPNGNKALLTVEEFSKDRSPTSNSLAPATVGTNFDLNYLHKLGDSMAAKDPVERMKSFGLDEHLIAPIMGLPGVSGGTGETSNLLSSLSITPVKASNAEINKSLNNLDSMLDQAMGSVSGSKKSDTKSTSSNPLLGGLAFATGGKVADSVKEQTSSNTSSSSKPSISAASKSDSVLKDSKKQGGLIDSFNGLVKDWLSPDTSSRDRKKREGSLLEDQNAKQILNSDTAKKAKTSTDKSSTDTPAEKK